MIAKLLVVDADRERAIERLRRSLDEVEITGIQTTIPFHRFVARHAGFRAGAISTDWVEDHWTPSVAEDRAAALDVAVVAAAYVAARSRRSSGSLADPSLDGRGEGRVSLRKDTDPVDGWARTGRERAIDRWPR
jgi:acetyl/propionyl-CoA carboxylase alpha subunit